MQCSIAAHSKHRLTGTVAVHKWCVIAGLCELHRTIGVIALPSKADFQLAMQSNTFAHSKHRLIATVAVH